MRIAAHLLVALLVGLAAGCDDGGGGRKTPLQATLYYEGTDPSYEEPVHLIVRDAEHWGEVWRTLTARPVPSVDFGEEVVVLVAVGRRPRVCYKLEMRSVTERNDEVELRLAEVAGDNCICLTTNVFPVMAVGINRPESYLRIHVDVEPWPDCDPPP